MPLFDMLATWQTAAASEREAAAKRLAAQLPEGFAFDAVVTRECGALRCDVARFRLGDAQFSLIPGGPVALGFDASLHQPSSDMIESWSDTADEYGLDFSLLEFIAKQTTARRIVTMPALLVETRYAEVGWQPLDAASEEVQALLLEYPGGVTLHRGERAVRVRVAPDGSVTAETADETGLCHDAVSNGFTQAGFRLPTPDEWEYLCGAGAPTLFRWGDHAPCDRYPIDVRPQEVEWEFHRDANAFGLHIAFNPYMMELTSEAGQVRGGDGGNAICGGAGFCYGWLALATAWRDAYLETNESAAEIVLGHSVARRVFSLA